MNWLGSLRDAEHLGVNLYLMNVIPTVDGFMSQCPICELKNQSVNTVGQMVLVDCKRCGKFKIDRDFADDLPSLVSQYKYIRPTLSKYVRAHSGSAAAVLTFEKAEKLAKDYVRPNPAEQAQDLLLHLDKTTEQEDGSRVFLLDPEELQSIVGAQNFTGTNYIISELEAGGYLKGVWKNFQRASGGTAMNGLFQGQITFDGWKLIQQLKVNAVQSKTAFMAMKFGDSELDNVVNNYIRPAVLQTGFRILRIDDEPKAGLIDDRMRLAIRSAKFLIADLTHGNPGAYWEAGFAEGLGKQVIYLCKKEVFDDLTRRPHFDTNHHLTVVWELKEIGKAMEMLKATIRYTLPEALQSD